jgi:hypothetical protein
MSSFGSPSPFFLAGKKAYEVERSLRFNDGDSANLTRTSSSTSTTFTYSAWIKRTHFSGYQYIFSMGSRGFAFHTNNNTFYLYDGSNLNESTAKFRDPSAWYHIVVQINSGVATSYVNGVLVHNAVGSGFTLTTGTNETRIGSQTSTYYFDGYMAEINLVDGSVVAPSSFAETDAITGQWNPKKYGGSYGTNGFYLNFSDNSGTTATTLGKDSSGNGNNFTPNNFSVAAGTGNDSLEDTPTNNFCTLNSVKKDGQTTLSNGNLQASGSQTSTYNINTQGTFAQSSGKWYYEVEFTSGSGSCAVGWARTTLRSSDNPTTGGGIIYRPTNGDYVDLAANNPTTPPTTSTGTVIQVAIDFDAGKIWFGSGGTYFNSGDPSAASNEAMTFTGGSELLAPVVRTMASTFNFNFGQRAFSYTVPTGYKSLCSANLPDPTILLPNKHFDTSLYTGNATSRSITGLNFQPDWVWIKNRSNAYHHGLFDAVRGANKILKSSDTSAEGTFTQQLMSFNSDGYTLGDNSDSGNYVNVNTHTYVGWNWKGGGSASSNSDGSSTSSVSANTSAGFSIVSYTGTGSATSFGHGLGVAPKIVFFKKRSGAYDWFVYTKLIDDSLDYVKLNTSDQKTNSGWSTLINSSSVLTMEGDSSAINGSGATYIAYCFSEVAGFSKFGSYTGNGSTDGTFVFTGFRPALVIFKRTNTGQSWYMMDNKRNTFNLTNTYLRPDTNAAEGDAVNSTADFLSNGFKFRGNGNDVNGSGDTYIYLAFAESPFKYARAR